MKREDMADLTALVVVAEEQNPDLEPVEVLPPDELAKLPPKLQRWFGRSGPFEFRHVYPRDELNPPKRPPRQQSR